MEGLFVAKILLNPLHDLSLYFLSRRCIFFSRAKDNCFTPTIPATEWRQCLSQKRLTPFTITQKFCNYLVIVKTRELCSSICFTKFSFKHFAVSHSHTECNH